MKEEIIESKTPKKKRLKKRLIKILLYIVGGIVGLNLLLYILLSIPFVQQKASDFAVDKLKSTLQTEVSIDELRLSLFNRVSLKGVYIQDLAKDTLLHAKSLDARINLWQLIKNNKLAITAVDLDDFVININQKDSVSDFNFQFIIDAFASKDTIKTDTTKSALQIAINNISIANGRLNFRNLSKTPTPTEFNASDISISDFNANVDINSVDTDKLDIDIKSFSAKDASGLLISNLTGHLFSEKSRMWVTDLKLTLPNSHLFTTLAEYDTKTNAFVVNTEDTEILASDLAPFLPNLKFLTEKIKLKTKVVGKLPALNIENLLLNYGDECVLDAQGEISNVSDYSHADINLTINKLKASAKQIEAFARLGDSTFMAPDIIKQLGDIRLKAKLSGRFAKFKLDGQAWSKQGAILLAATGNADSIFNNFAVKAQVQTQSFNLSQIVGNGLGKVSAVLNADLSQSPRKGLAAKAKGQIHTLQYGKETLKRVFVDGFYDSDKMGVEVKADWKIGAIKAYAEMSQAKIAELNLKVSIDSLKVDRFYANESWVDPRLTLRLNGAIKDFDIDKMIGKVAIDSLDFRDQNFSFAPGPISLELSERNDSVKFIRFASSFFKADVIGKYKFMSIADEFTNLMNGYLSNIFLETSKVKTNRNDFVFNATIQNIEELVKIIDIPLVLSEPATIKGHINMIGRKIDIGANIPKLWYGNTEIAGARMRIANLDSAFNITASASMPMELGNYGLSLIVTGSNNSMRATAGIVSDKTPTEIKGKVDIQSQFSRNENNVLESLFEVIPSTIHVDKLALDMLPGKILYRNNRTEVHQFGIAIGNKKYVTANGVVSPLKTDSLHIVFDKARIGDLLDAFDVKNIQGVIDGTVTLTNLLETPEYYTKNFEIEDIIVFKDTLGTLKVNSEWNNELKGIRLNAELARGTQNFASINGMVYTSPDSLDLKIAIEKFPVGWAQPFASDFVNHLSGSISSNLVVSGTSKIPYLAGFLGFNNTSVGIDYTNVVYTISDTIQIRRGEIGFKNLTLKDMYGNTANINATLTHQKLSNMKYTVNATLNNLMALSTANRTDSLFYGNIFLSGNAKITGDDNSISMDIQAQNNKKSVLNIQIPQTSVAGDYQSVVYINVPPEKRIDDATSIFVSPSYTKILPLKMDVNMSLDQDLDLSVVIDPKTGDMMRVKGVGKIKFSYDMQKDIMNTFGEYIVSDGNVKLNLQNISKLDFKIREGSKLTFIGSPLKTKFDITAFRRVKADLKTLDPAFDNENGSTKVEVDCILKIDGNLDIMDLSYEISLPSASDDIKQRVAGLISTDEQKIRQFAYLIVVGSFQPSTGGSGTNITNGLWTNIASSTLSSGLDAVFSNIFGKSIEIGTNIESNDGSLSDVNVSVNVSKKFFNDKLRIKTNVGYRSEQSSSTNNNLIGDFDVEYMINKLWTLTAYSHANDQFFRQAATTQGIGIVYSKEASTLKRLFQSFKPKRRSETVPSNPSDSTLVKQLPLVEEKSKQKTNVQP